MTATISGTSGGIGLIGSGTAQNSTSGTAINFTGIPAGVKRITVMFNGVSTSGSSNIQVQLGSGSYTTTGYTSSADQFSTGGTYTSATTGFLVTGANSSTYAQSGQLILSLLSSNTWVSSGLMHNTGGALNASAGNSPSLGGALDRLRITTVNGTDTFDAGSINILYE